MQRKLPRVVLNKKDITMNTIKYFTSLLLLSLTINLSAGDIEISPFLGYTAGGSFENADNGNELDIMDNDSFGLILGMRDPYREEAMLELFFMRKETSLDGDGQIFNGENNISLDINYLHLGGTYTYSEPDARVRPFVSGGLGVTYMDAESADSEVRPSFSLGLGMRVPITDHLTFRLEGRGFGTFFDSESTVFCVDNQCLINVKSDMFWQFTAFAALTFTF